MHYIHRIAVLCLLLTGSAISGKVFAETLADALTACANKSNSLERLVCYDDVVKQLRNYERGDSELVRTSKAPVVRTQDGPVTPVVPTAKVEQNQDDVDAFGRPQQQQETATTLVDGKLYSTIVEIRKASNRRLRFVLENGQIWEKTEGSTAGLPKVGDSIVIRSEALGAFYMRKPDVNRSFKVKRITK